MWYPPVVGFLSGPIYHIKYLKPSNQYLDLNSHLSVSVATIQIATSFKLNVQIY